MDDNALEGVDSKAMNIEAIQLMTLMPTMKSHHSRPRRILPSIEMAKSCPSSAECSSGIESRLTALTPDGPTTLAMHWIQLRSAVLDRRSTYPYGCSNPVDSSVGGLIRTRHIDEHHQQTPRHPHKSHK